MACIVVEGPSKKGVNFWGAKNLILTLSEPREFPRGFCTPAREFYILARRFEPERQSVNFYFILDFKTKNPRKIHTKIHRLSKAGEFP